MIPFPIRSALWLFVFVALRTAVMSLDDDATIVHTNDGSIQGVIDSQARRFTKIPFAKPPVGDLRWADPVEPDSWSPNILQTTQPSPGCPQDCDFNLQSECPPVISEDCLYLDVYTPLDAQNDKTSYSVLLYIHGGTFLFGGSGGLQFNGTKLVNLTNTIFVSINYRLGALGFLFNDHSNSNNDSNINKSSNMNISDDSNNSNVILNGNYGYLDQLLAMKWVYDNIKYFGGNPNKITIFGESAGAMSVNIHLYNSNNQKQYINGAIMESNPIGLPLRSIYDWNNVALNLGDLVGCKTQDNNFTMQCMRSVNASTIVQHQMTAADKSTPVNHLLLSNMPYVPTVGTGLITNREDINISQPVFAVQNGNVLKDIPIIIGVNKGEAFDFISGYPDLFLSGKAFKDELDGYVGVEASDKIYAFYNISQYANNDTYNVINISAQINTDSIFKCVSRNVTREYSKNIGINAYYYHFNHVSSFNKYVYPNNTPCWNHVCHTAELFYVFEPTLGEQVGTNSQAGYTDQEKILSQQFQYYWANFANTNDPSNGGSSGNVKWLPYSEKDDKQGSNILVLDVGDELQLIQDPDDYVCHFWDSLGYTWLNGVYSSK